MTWVWRICFSLALLTPARPAAVSGAIRLVDSRAPAVRKHQDYSGVVAWLEPVRLAEDMQAGQPPRAARMEQRDKEFLPHVLAIQAGASVAFPNFDPIFHNAFSNYGGQIFDLGLYAPGTSRTVTFTRPGIVHVFCNIHPTMSAVIVVLKRPWFAVSNGTGAFLIRDVPPGQYRLHVYHERATSATLRALERAVTVSGEDVALPPVSISETGYVEAPHQNKYGLDYPPAGDEPSPYPARAK